jgi:signal transduction histidine kinase
LRAQDGWVHVSVRDDGIGFDTGLPSAGGHGLLGMRYRLETEGGQLSIDSRPGRGTFVEADLPESTEIVTIA